LHSGLLGLDPRGACRLHLLITQPRSRLQPTALSQLDGGLLGGRFRRQGRLQLGQPASQRPEFLGSAHPGAHRLGVLGLSGPQVGLGVL
jgi:hypothetical protein